MPASIKRQFCSLHDICALAITTIMDTHLEIVVLLLRLLLFSSLLALFVLCFVSAQTLLLAALLWVVSPRLALQYSNLNHVQASGTSADALGPMRVDNKQKDPHQPQKKTHSSDERRKSDSVGEWDESIDFAMEVGERLETANEGLVDRITRQADPVETRQAELQEVTPKFEAQATDGDKENEAPSPASTPRRTGLKPLTLTLTNLPSREVREPSSSKRTVSLCNSAKRLSSVFYVSDENRDVPRPTTARTAAETAARRKSLPAASLLGKVDNLATRLEEERNQNARLRGDLHDLRDRDHARERELAECKQQALDLGAAIEARDGIIRDLCLGVESLEQENAGLKETAWRIECRKAANEARAEELAVTQQLLQQVRMVELGHRWTLARFQKQVKMEKEGSPKDEPEGTHVFETNTVEACVKPEEITEGLAAKETESTSRRILHQDFEIAHASSLDSIFKPSPGPSLQLTDTLDFSKATEVAEEARLQDDDAKEDIKFEFPTISPRLPPCHAAAHARTKVIASAAIPSSGTIIYEVDGSALAEALHTIQGSTTSAQQQCTSYEECCGGRYDLSAAPSSFFPDYEMQRDSDFYAVPVSVFGLPYPLGQEF